MNIQIEIDTTAFFIVHHYCIFESKDTDRCTSRIIQENIKSLELEKKVILEEHLSTRKELEGLSSAYTNLEEEYNNISKNGSIKEEVIAVSSYRKVEEENQAGFV